MLFLPTLLCFHHIIPYTPPAIKTSLLNKIHKQEFIDFDELSPPPISINDDQFLGFELHPSSTSLLLKHNKQKFKLHDFASWMCAWNIFVQAYLYFHPTMHHALFSYLKNVCTFIRKFKFESKAQRTQIAAENSLPTFAKSTSWKQQNEEFFNLYLRDNYLPACYHCNAYGHFATSCPYRTGTLCNPPNSFRPQQSHYTYISAVSPNTSNQSFRDQLSAPKPVTSTSSHTICNRFNQTGFCKKPPCQLLHVCNLCNKAGQPGTRCFSRTNTSFIP